MYGIFIYLHRWVIFFGQMLAIFQHHGLHMGLNCHVRLPDFFPSFCHVCFATHTHMLHVWNIYLHLGHVGAKCWQIYNVRPPATIAKLLSNSNNYIWFMDVYGT